MIDREEAEITGPTQIKLRMVEVRICGTDTEICRFACRSPPEGSDY
jgi:threonine dehydrogenase-like Zn-dependent dehydrogenase